MRESDSHGQPVAYPMLDVSFVPYANLLYNSINLHNCTDQRWKEDMWGFFGLITGDFR